MGKVDKYVDGNRGTVHLTIIITVLRIMGITIDAELLLLLMLLPVLLSSVAIG